MNKYTNFTRLAPNSTPIRELAAETSLNKRIERLFFTSIKQLEMKKMGFLFYFFCFLALPHHLIAQTCKINAYPQLVSDAEKDPVFISARSGQTFTATKDGQITQITANIHLYTETKFYIGIPNGGLLPETDLVEVTIETTNSNSFRKNDFFLHTPFNVTSGTTYEIQVRANHTGYYSVAPYAGGTYTRDGVPDNSKDLAFEIIIGAGTMPTLSDALQNDLNNNGVADEGETLRYTAKIGNPAAIATENAVFTLSPEANTSLVVGSVTTAQGTVTTGNTAGDNTISIDLGSIPAGDTTTVIFDCMINSNLPSPLHYVQNQGTVTIGSFTRKTADLDLFPAFDYDHIDKTTTLVYVDNDCKIELPIEGSVEDLVSTLIRANKNPPLQQIFRPCQDGYIKDFTFTFSPNESSGSTDITNIKVFIEEDPGYKNPFTTIPSSPVAIFDYDPTTGYQTHTFEINTAISVSSGTSYVIGFTSNNDNARIVLASINYEGGGFRFEDRVESEQNMHFSMTISDTPPVASTTVIINQGSSQADPTNSTSIVFDVVFSESVTGFETGDVTLSGTAGATTATVSGSGANYTVTVTGMTQSGTVVASIAQGVATATSGETNSASTSTDNEVTFEFPPFILDLTGPTSVTEGTGSDTPVTFSIKRTGSILGTASVEFILIPYTVDPVSTTDFIGTPLQAQTVNFSDGASQRNVVVSISGDSQAEKIENFYALIRNIDDRGSYANSLLLVSVVDDDTPVGIAGSDIANACNNPTALSATSNPTISGMWNIISGVGGSFLDASDPESSFTGTAGTSYVLRWTSGGVSDDICVSFAGDTDNDGVNDCVDKCPLFDDTIDDDMDGVPDACDCDPTSAAVALLSFPANMQIPDGLHQSDNIIESAGLVNVDQGVIHRAAVSVELKPGFEVKQGANFLAYIGPCTYNPDYQAAPFQQEEIPSIAKINTSNTTNLAPLTLTAYPNPARDVVQVVFEIAEKTPLNLSIFNSMGKLIGMPLNKVERPAGRYLQTMEVSHLPPGIYHIALQTNKEKALLKIVVQR